MMRFISALALLFAAAPAIAGPPAGWNVVSSCAVDKKPGRIITQFSINLPNNSPTTCTSICAGKGFKYAAVEYGKECFCGNSLAYTPPTAPKNKCNYACTGDKAQTCGGFWHMQVYQKA